MTERSDLRRASLLAASGPKAPCGKLSTPRPPDPGQSHDACDQALAAFSGLAPVTCPRRPRCCPPPPSSPWAKSGSRRCTSRPGVPRWPRPPGGRAGRSARALSWPAAPAGPAAQRLPLRACDPRPTSPRWQVVALVACAALEPGDLRGQAAARWPARAAMAATRRWAPRQAGRLPARSSSHPVPASCPGTPGRHDDDVQAERRVADDGPRVRAVGDREPGLAGCSVVSTLREATTTPWPAIAERGRRSSSQRAKSHLN